MNTEKSMITVYSSWGEFTCDEDGTIYEWGYGKPSYEFDNDCPISQIQRFDFKEFDQWFSDRYGFQHGYEDYDILELGYWRKDGTYVEACNWRYEVRKGLENSGILKPVPNCYLNAYNDKDGKMIVKPFEDDENGMLTQVATFRVYKKN